MLPVALALFTSTDTVPSLTRLSSASFLLVPLVPIAALVSPLVTTLWTYTFPAFSMPPLPSCSVAAWVLFCSATALLAATPSTDMVKVAGRIAASTFAVPTVSTFTSAFLESSITFWLVDMPTLARSFATASVTSLASWTVRFDPA